jgi:hypothetical protein
MAWHRTTRREAVEKTRNALLLAEENASSAEDWKGIAELWLSLATELGEGGKKE